MSDDVIANDHLLLTGPSGKLSDYGGKTATAVWWADNVGRQKDLVVFLNSKQDDVAGKLDGYVEVPSVDAAADAIADGQRYVIITPTDPDWEAVSRRLEQFVRALGTDLGEKAVLLDEAPELDAEAVLSFVRVHGNGSNCQAILIAQSPTDVSTSIVKGVLIVWVGPMKSDYESWFKTHDRGPAFDYIQQHHDLYEWTVVLGPGEGEWTHYPAVPEEYAP